MTRSAARTSRKRLQDFHGVFDSCFSSVRVWSRELYNQRMAKRVMHISEKEAATTNIATLLAHVRAGVEVVIENGNKPVAIIHSAEPIRRTISECIALLPEESTATLDPGFAKDVEAAIESHREPLDPHTWD